MKRITGSLKCFFSVAAMLVVSGCASTLMTKTTELKAPAREKALVTFVRPSMFGGAIQFGLWDSEKFIGILSAKSYVQYAAEPGEHLFMARAENWSYLKAHLEAGKRYYVIGKVFPGIWKARVAMNPVKKSDLAKAGEAEKVSKWLKELTPTTPMESKVEGYTTPRLAHVRQSIEEFKKGKVEYVILEADDGR